MNEEELEKKNKRIALLYTTIIQAVLFVVLFFMVAWRAPDPPLPEYGIVLNFGTDDEGSGDVQPETPVGNKGQQEEEPEESKPKVQEETPKVEEKETKPVESKPVEQQIVSKVESPVVVKEKKEDEVKPVEKPAEKPEEKKVEPKVEKKPVEEKPKVDPEAVYKPKAAQSSSDNKTTDTKAGTPGNHGDDPGKTGDKGKPEGTPDARGLYDGKQGGGSNGVSTSGLKGFKWPEIIIPEMPEGAYGVYEFTLKVDDQGNMASVQPEKRGLSLEAERRLKAYLQKLVFEVEGSDLPPLSEGKITIKIVSK
jgi:protein TonB